MPLAELIAHRARELTAYQDEAYARRYLARVEQAAAAEAALGEGHGESLTRAVAINLFRLMAYKDEYEVARLYTDGRFARALGETFTGGKAKVWLAPPILSPKGRDGRPGKRAFGGWMLSAAFPFLSRFKGLRGGPFDLFGYTEERRMERALIGDYETALDKLLAGLTLARLPLAVRIANVPQAIRGFGHVKLAGVKAAKAEEVKLWTRWEAEAP